MQKKLLFFTLITAFLCSCNSYKEYKQTRMAMGTIVQITVLAQNADQGEKAINKAFDEINRIGSHFWEGNPESPVYKFSHRKTNSVNVGKEVLDIVKRSCEISKNTNGNFDMTIGILTRLYNYKGDNPVPPPADSINKYLPYVNYKQLEFDTLNNVLYAENNKTMLAVGAIVKGYAVDRAVAVLDNEKLGGILVNAGGDLRVTPRVDGRKWVLGVQDPRNREAIRYYLEIDEGAVTTSGDYEKYFIYEGKRIHHLLNPHTGYPADKCQSVTVIAPTAELADALATALFVAGADEGKKLISNYPGVEALWIGEKQETETSDFSTYIVR